MKVFGSKNGFYVSSSGTGSFPFSSRSRLARGIAAVSGLTLSAVSSLSFAIGLGDMQAKSYLGQPLTANIELVSLDSSLDLDRLIVRQVPAAEAVAMGVDVSFTPYRFDLKVDNSDGTPRVAIASSEAIREPYLNLLIELRWPTGVLYREYPLLLDPPPSINAAAVARRQVPVESSSPSVPSHVRVERPPAPARMELPPLRTTEGKYQVQAGDSLSRIAERWREGTSQGIGETMQWLHENNPEAFARGDINQLLAGAVLQMPDLGAYHVADTRAAPPEMDSRTQSPVSPNDNSARVPRTAAPTSNSGETEVGRDAARADGGSGLLTVGAANREDKTREMIDLLVRENESLKERVEKLESSEYLDTLKQLIVLQRQQITQLRSELGVDDGAVVAEMDALLAQVGVAPAVAPSTSSTVSELESENASPEALPATKMPPSELANEGQREQGLVALKSSTRPATEQPEENRGWFLWFVIGAGLLLASLFAAMYAYYRKLVPVRSAEEEYADLLTPVEDEEPKAGPSFTASGPRNADDDFILYDGAPQPLFTPKKGQGNDDWMGEKVNSLDADNADAHFAIEDVQKSFEGISLDEEALVDLDGIHETSLEAITGEMPKESSESIKSVKKAKDKPSRRPDEEVKMSIAEKMSQYNPEEYRQELESLGFLELDELVDLDESDEDEVEAIVYRAMMFCEFKKFDKAIDLIESKMELVTDERLEHALEDVRSLRSESDASSRGVKAS